MSFARELVEVDRCIDIALSVADLRGRAAIAQMERLTRSPRWQTRAGAAVALAFLASLVWPD